MNKKLRDRYLIISAIQLFFLPAITLLQQLAVRNDKVISYVARINQIWPEKYPVSRLMTSSIIFFVLMTWAIMHFHQKNKRYQSKSDRIYPMIPAEVAMVLLGYTSFVSYLSTEVLSTYYLASLLLAIAVLMEIAKVSYYLVSCPNSTIEPKLKNQKKKQVSGNKGAGQKAEFVKRSKKK